MKNLRLIIVIAVSLLWVGVASAQTQLKIASVDLKKLFNGYYKTKLAEDLLDKDQADARKGLRELADNIDKAQTDYKQLLGQEDDPAISSDARDKIKQSVDDKAQQITSLKADYERELREADATLSDKKQRMMTNLFNEIQKAVSDKARLGGYTLVVDSASSEAVVYVSPDTDITASVLSQLNAGAPVDVSAPASTGLDLNAGTNSQ
jgi:outer membrane protein